MGRSGTCGLTIVAHNYLAQAELLASSWRRHHPEWTFFILLVDHPVSARCLSSEHATIIPITAIDFGVEGFEMMAAIYSITEFATAVKPFAIDHLLDRHECVVYLDPDIEVFAPLTELVDATREAGWSVTPHTVHPIDRDGRGPSERDIMAAGVYNLGFVAVTRRRRDLLEWWGERLRRDAVVDVAQQLFTDQRWIDLAVPIFAPHIERGTSYNVAYWNLDKRRLWLDGSGRHMVDDDLLRFFHYSGHDPSVPHLLTRYHHEKPRVLLSENPAVDSLVSSYADRLRAARAAHADLLPYGWANAAPGITLTDSIRRLLRDELIRSDLGECPRPPSPFEPGGAQEFVEWLRKPADWLFVGLPRYLYVEWLRPDLQSGFAEVGHGETTRFLTWARRQGVHQSSLLRMLGVGLDTTGRHLPAGIDRGVEVPGVDVVGHLRSKLGVGEAGRAVVRALRAAEVDVSVLSVPAPWHREDDEFPVDHTASHGAMLLAVNENMVQTTLARLGRPMTSRRHLIGQWFWEVDPPPEQWRNTMTLLDEIWAPTMYLRDLILTRAPKGFPVVHMPLPVTVGDTVSDDARCLLGLDDRFMFLFAFDFFSVAKRKNVTGLIDAYLRAFPVPGNVQLVIKTINGQHRLGELECLRWMSGSRPDITVWDGHLDRDAALGLIASADCYVSLHRSEGLGLTIAEAMALGTPVIATGYSGNMDYMTPDNSIPIPWTLTRVGPGTDPYPADAVWAEPDLDAAAAAMRRMHADTEFRSRVAREARRHTRERFSAEACGRRMKERLEAIRYGRK
jgi:glycosyltransferase involved in cell wall biosynthesis